MNGRLSGLDKSLKVLIAVYLITIIIGVSVGIVYLAFNTSLTPKGTVERFNGSVGSGEDQFEIEESYPKPISEMLMTTHNHILGLSTIFLSAGLIFYFNSFITGKWRSVLMIEPLISLHLTFGSIWLVRYVDHTFIYVTYLSSLMMYLSFYFITILSLYELLFRKND